jgi:flagellar FliJ protein
MSGLKSVMLAIEVATQKRDHAGKQLGQVQRALLFAQGQLDQLASYAADSEAKWSVTAQVSATPELMRHHYQFMDRLRQAMGLQDGVMNDAKAQVEMARKQLLEMEFRLASLKQILSRKQAAQKVVQDRREQRQMDEFATQLYGRFTAQQHNGEKP